MKRLLPALCCSTLGIVTACGDSTGPETGSINLAVVLPAPNGPSSQSRAPAEELTHLESIRVTIAGPTNKTATFDCNARCEGTIDELAEGSYTVTVEGLVGNAVAHYGQTSGVQVVAGETATATVSTPCFQPVLLSPSTILNAPDTTEVLHFAVSFQTVTGAASYVVEWAKSSDFSGASSATVTGTSTEVTVSEEALWHVQVRAVNEKVGNNGMWSAPGAVVALQGVATVTVTPANPTINAGATQQFSAAAVDGDGNPVSNVTFFWSSSNHNVATVNQSGLATAINSGQVTITAVGKGQPGSTALTVGTQAATKLAFSVQPANTTAGEAVSPAVQVEIQDANGNRVTSARDPVTIAIGTNPGSGTLAGTKVVNAINGIASFSGLWINKSGTGYTLATSSPSLTGSTSGTFNITPAAPARLAFSGQPSNSQGNTVFNPAVAVTITDIYDNVVTTASNQVTVSLGVNPWLSVFSPGGALSGTRTVAAAAGVATFIP